MISKNKIDEDFKFFLRFLKEKGVYSFLHKYLLYGGRTSEDLFKSIQDIKNNSSNYHYHCFDLLHMTPTLGKGYCTYGHYHWETFIKPISDELVKYKKSSNPYKDFIKK